MLSKSKIMRGKQCHKSLWLYRHAYNLREINEQQQAIFQTGTDVGILAQGLFPKGIDATKGHDYPNLSCYKQTKKLIDNGQNVIYEATFVYDDVLVAVDLLVKNGNKWNLYEVKSSTSVKPQHIEDATVQYYVAKGCGIDIENIYITHLNNTYERKGDLDIQQLFTATAITDEVKAGLDTLPETIEKLKEVEKLKKCPQIDVGEQCNTPYPCDYMNYCWKDIPYFNVVELVHNRGKAQQLIDMGITDLKDIPDDFPLTINQQIQVDAEKTEEDYIDEKAINLFLNEISYPIYYLDFETIMPAIPPLDNTKPYGQTVFQYSLHIEEFENAELVHKEYLAETDGTDPRTMFLQKLIKDCGTKGTVLVYNKTFECSRLKELATIFPKYNEEINNILNRIVDLMQPFQQKQYYTKEMHGSYSIKAVLPALAPQFSYTNLEISDGGTASNIFYALFEGKYTGNKAKARKALLEYCQMDTYAMVVVMQKLRTIV
ncbi:MAG: DUF2779 domain-containing protein [Bacteroidetes bacterium]|nr:DUF2779 domain-containing protein [Bacteroidota bacterium]MCB9227419.1 DUF2779 domain-containing protein [Chitinophagales bacterium]